MLTLDVDRITAKIEIEVLQARFLLTRGCYVGLALVVSLAGGFEAACVLEQGHVSLSADGFI